MIPDPDQDLIFLYVAGVADADETARAEALLSSASPSAAATYAEALAVFHAMPFALDAVRPPASVFESLMSRVEADRPKTVAPVFAAPSPMKIGPTPDYVSKMRWPVYVASGLAACLAVALSLSVWNATQLAAKERRLSETNARMATTLEDSKEVLRSPNVSLASLQTSDKTDKSFGRVLFCPVTRQYQVTVFGLPPLPPGKAYELWLITPDQRKIPAGMLALDENGTATVMAQPQQKVDVAALAAITDEPAAGSLTPTGSIRLAGALTVTPAK